MDKITGRTLIEWGFEPSPQFPHLIATARTLSAEGKDKAEIVPVLEAMKPARKPVIPMRSEVLPYSVFLEAENEDEQKNAASVFAHMDELMRVPTIRGGAVMPDACPSGSAPGTIPVGGVVACADAIHPGFHSADICCSMAITVLGREVSASRVLDSAMKLSHFGPGKRSASEVRRNKDLVALVNTFDANPFLKDLEDYGIRHFMTQGDGNHFFYVGQIESTGQTAIVTHHGSRGLGARLYKRGKLAAERYTKSIAPSVPSHNAWIAGYSYEGEQYWRALQTIRTWTEMNHYAIHDAVIKDLNNSVADRYWNEHNFVFRRTDGLFYHAKGATPAYLGKSLIPMNMGQPILITMPGDCSLSSLGFAPHGAGRNMSRTNHIKRLMSEFGDHRGLGPNSIKAIIERETGGLDIRFYTGMPDVSELPSAYKNPQQVEAAIRAHKLADIQDRVLPLGSIMAGEVKWAR